MDKVLIVQNIFRQGKMKTTSETYRPSLLNQDGGICDLMRLKNS
jgi:hypothetical protein